MSKAKAQVEKEKGNAAFKAQDYVGAIGHYTAAIIQDRDDITFPLNRGAAYLKLGKFQDAERDCSTVLTKTPTNVKALFRRAQARIELENFDDAKHDLQEALRLEPANQAVKDELLKITARQETVKSEKRDVPKTIPAPQPPKRRRIPIKIVEPPIQPAEEIAPSKGEASKSALIQEISSRSLPANDEARSTAGPTTASAPSASRPLPNSFKEAKQLREETKTTRVGGGIFRASGQHTAFPTRDLPIQKKSSNETASSTSSGSKLPRASQRYTLFDFNRKWDSDPSDEARWDLLQSAIPSGIPLMFKASLEASFLASILKVLLWALENDTSSKPTVQSILTELAKVPRFDTVLLFFSPSERQVAKEVWGQLGAEVPGAWRSVV